MLQKFFKNKNISKKLKLRLKNTIDKTLTYASETWTLTKRDRKQLNVFERKVYRRILGPIYNNENERRRILTNKEIYARVKKPTVIETIRLNRLCLFGHVQRMEENRLPKRVLYTRSVRKVSGCIFLCEHLMDYNLARLHEPTLNLSAHA